ncbi:MAG: hypothetical protein MJZ88_05060 [Paludibacteraceae bacterium]|nr:hypothetical protein [Paludibacteraceae bacterium]
MLKKIFSLFAALTLSVGLWAGITVNVTVPAGTPACYFYGEMSGNTFVEMTKVDETHYTTTFDQATTIGWGYLFAWEADNWNTKNAEDYFTVEPVNGVINVEVKAWGTNPAPAPKYYAKNNWDGGEWTWKEMTQDTEKKDIYTLNNVVFGGEGFKINTKEDDTDALDFNLEDIEVVVSERIIILPRATQRQERSMHAPNSLENQPQKLLPDDIVQLFFNAADSTLKVNVFGRPAAPTTSIVTLPNEEKVGGEVVKFFHNGQLYIRKDEKTYNALGAGL